MGLEVIARFFRTMSDEVSREVFGEDELTEIFRKYDDETIKFKGLRIICENFLSMLEWKRTKYR